MRVLLFTGKGGVGKTTLAASTAVLAAARGRRTLVLSADPAHSLGDVLDRPVGSEPVRVDDRLDAMEVEAGREIERHWGVVRDFLVRFFESQGVDELRASELAVLPGFDEVVSLLAVRDAARSGDYDTIVLDCAPTAATLRLLSLPEAARWYMKRVFPVQRTLVGTMAPAAEKIVGVPMPTRPVFAALEQFYEALREVGEQLSNPETTSVRLVTNPEAVVVRETQRAYTALNLWGYSVDAVLVNKVVPDAAGNTGLVRQMADAQRQHRRSIQRAFWFLPQRSAVLAPGSCVGLQGLGALGSSLYGDDDPAERMAESEGLCIARKQDGYDLTVDVPEGSGSGVSVFARQGELVIAAGNNQHNVLLPTALAGLQPKARLSGRQLVVQFR